MFRLERKEIEADGKALVFQTRQRSDGAIAIRSSGTVFIISVEIEHAVNKWGVREFHWRAFAEGVSAIGAERKKGDEVISAGAEGSGCGHEDEAAPERIHGIRFAGIEWNAKKKKTGRKIQIPSSKSQRRFKLQVERSPGPCEKPLKRLRDCWTTDTPR